MVEAREVKQDVEKVILNKRTIVKGGKRNISIINNKYKKKV
jgi:hypothetical protein